MTSLAFMLMLQFVVSTKAGMVNHVEGSVSVKAAETAAAGVPITTGSGGYAEILLNPGSFLRLGENSEAVLDSVDLTDIVVRTLSGPSIVEVAELDDNYPITVTTGDLTVELLDPGLYKFENGKATVYSGKLRTKDSRVAYKKGWTLFNPVGGLRAMKVSRSDTPTTLEIWSKNRSSLITKANVESFESFRNEKTAWSGSTWMWVPGFGAWTFIPGSRMASPYGYRYRGHNEISSERHNDFSATTEGYSTGGQSPSQTQPSSGVSIPTPGSEPPSPTIYSDIKNEPVAPATIP